MDNELEDEGASRASKRRRQEEEEEGSVISLRRSDTTSNFRPMKLDLYDGKTLSGLRNYLRRCETMFRLAPKTFATDRTKVLYASQFLDGEVSNVFKRREKEKGEDNTLWEEYTMLLRNYHQDPVT